MNPHSDDALVPPRKFVPVDDIAAGLNDMPSWDTESFREELAELDLAVDDDPLDRFS